MNYKELSKEFLDSNGASIGDKVKITNKNTSYKGTILDRTVDAEDAYIVLKLENGYNIGINIEDAGLEIISKFQYEGIIKERLDLPYSENKNNVSLLSTGGTVASMYDNKTGGVHPNFNAEDLIKINEDIVDLANIKAKTVINILSEDINVDDWVKISNSVYDEINDGADGVVVSHGTDTMHYTAAALSFMIKTPVPIVLTGAQRSSDRPSTDAYLNIYNAVGAATSNIAETLICMHSDLNDDSSYLHRGVKTRKMHTSRRDTFRSINTKPLAIIKDAEIISMSTDKYQKRDSCKLEINNDIEEKVALIKSYPGISTDIIDYHIDKGYKGILIEGTGLGHCPEKLLDSVQRANDSDIPVVMSSQCIYGKVNMNVYSTGRRLISAGVISAGDMTSEAAYVKLSWALGQSDSLAEIKEIMNTNIAGEFVERSLIDNFLI